ncbi:MULTISPECIES: cell wall hydrolase [Sphingobium]|jgi:spore germination cell wall hydrolase CwlJ-like protein|uniref:Cell wall hydrolase n=2 Tax=Sphingobium fuliginis (strain ATCC 27551) TaxID=336203 RepID=A0A292ZCJ2_SPHSA|nr:MULTISPECIES: cell wall hydrolase [Sphingobium]OAP30805.1 hydrolase [Sphingobium sp. 20006FA]AJR23147.1 hydrolase [Sphingobium sp. YBL2]KXU33235.1 hydrolase [Sphingobium sp. AM]KYC31562.1 hydrolase [Sphingobium sp. 22B]MCB4858507.1 cell wall hydrolase [Sphingobium sp. PNB]
MSFRLKAAIFAAFSLSATAAVTAADMSSASEAAPSVLSLPGSNELNAAPAGATPAVTFAAPREVVQPLAPLSDSADVKADNLAALVDAQGAAEDVSGDMKCLAGAVYFESKGESLEGQLAVARVIINRARSGRFADSLCGVVYQPGQFSFVRGNGMPSIRLGSESWREAVAIAQIAMDDSWDSKAEGALYFHARRVSPGWGKRQLAAIDNHVFYR